MSRIIAILLLCFAGCSQYSGAPTSARPGDVCDGPVTDPKRTSLVALLANPDRFEGKPVAVIGFYHGSFEHSALYLGRDDFRHYVTSNGLWVANNVPESLNDHYVLVEGIFSAQSRGHLGQWSGIICGVSKAVPWGGDEP
jgi:hypothetical protein